MGFLDFFRAPRRLPNVYMKGKDELCIYFGQSPNDSPATQRVTGILVIYNFANDSFQIGLVPKHYDNVALLSLLQREQGLNIEGVSHEYLPELKTLQAESAHRQQIMDKLGREMQQDENSRPLDHFLNQAKNSAMRAPRIAQETIKQKDETLPASAIPALSIEGEKYYLETQKLLEAKGLLTEKTSHVLGEIREDFQKNSEVDPERIQQMLGKYLKTGMKRST